MGKKQSRAVARSIYQDHIFGIIPAEMGPLSCRRGINYNFKSILTRIEQHPPKRVRESHRASEDLRGWCPRSDLRKRCLQRTFRQKWMQSSPSKINSLHLIGSGQRDLRTCKCLGFTHALPGIHCRRNDGRHRSTTSPAALTDHTVINPLMNVQAGGIEPARRDLIGPQIGIVTADAGQVEAVVAVHAGTDSEHGAILEEKMLATAPRGR
ncbi:hypothetical protein [Pseudotabrizicola algicola]|uniref:hypothetical protein n=1 Tax=Pseudotabrizicola algicola TaxID=2709381 RepID=UPI0013DED51C|nr:hypothetical protein [Pseudotabrizicola algicola]